MGGGLPAPPVNFISGCLLWALAAVPGQVRSCCTLRHAGLSGADKGPLSPCYRGAAGRAGRKHRALTQTTGLGPALTPGPCQRKRRVGKHLAAGGTTPRTGRRPAAEGAESAGTSTDLSSCCAPLSSQGCRERLSAPSRDAARG